MKPPRISLEINRPSRVKAAHQVDSKTLPAIIIDAGPKSARRFLELFTLNIRNANTRAAYLPAVRKFDAWCQARHLTLDHIELVAVAAYIEELGRTYPKPTVRQALAAIRMLFEWMVVLNR